MQSYLCSAFSRLPELRYRRGKEYIRHDGIILSVLHRITAICTLKLLVQYIFSIHVTNTFADYFCCLISSVPFSGINKIITLFTSIYIHRGVKC